MSTKYLPKKLRKERHLLNRLGLSNQGMVNLLRFQFCIHTFVKDMYDIILNDRNNCYKSVYLYLTSLEYRLSSSVILAFSYYEFLYYSCFSPFFIIHNLLMLHNSSIHSSTEVFKNQLARKICYLLNNSKSTEILLFMNSLDMLSKHNIERPMELNLMDISSYNYEFLLYMCPEELFNTSNYFSPLDTNRNALQSQAFRDAYMEEISEKSFLLDTVPSIIPLNFKYDVTSYYKKCLHLFDPKFNDYNTKHYKRNLILKSQKFFETFGKGDLIKININTKIDIYKEEQILYNMMVFVFIKSNLDNWDIPTAMLYFFSFDPGTLVDCVTVFKFYNTIYKQKFFEPCPYLPDNITNNALFKLVSTPYGETNYFIVVNHIAHIFKLKILYFIVKDGVYFFKDLGFSKYNYSSVNKI